MAMKDQRGKSMRCWFPNLLQKYMMVSFIPPFLVTCSFFVAFLLASQLFRFTTIVASKGIDLLGMLELAMHIGISFLPAAVPISVLFATMTTLGKLSEDSEIIAMRSFGLTKEKLLWPFILIALILSQSIFLLNHNLVPYSELFFRNTRIMLASKGVATNIQAGQFFTDIPNVILFSEQVDNGGLKMRDVFIRREGENGGDMVIFAESGVLIKQEFDGSSFPLLRLHLSNGNLFRTNSNGEDSDKILFKEYDFPLIEGEGTRAFGFIVKSSMLSSKELVHQIAEAKAEGIQEGDHLIKMQIEYWKRWNTSLQIMVFTLLGFTLGVKRWRGKQRNNSLMGITILILYYVVFFLGISLARKEILPAWLTVFIPTLMALIFGVRNYRKLDWAN